MLFDRLCKLSQSCWIEDAEESHIKLARTFVFFINSLNIAETLVDCGDIFNARLRLSKVYVVSRVWHRTGTCCLAGTADLEDLNMPHSTDISDEGRCAG